MTNLETIPGMTQLQAAFAAAQSDRRALGDRYAEAEQAVARAHSAQLEIIIRAAAGKAVSPAESKGAADAFNDAKSHATMLGEAMKQTDKATLRAERDIAKAKSDHAEQMFIAASEHVLALAERGDALGLEIEAFSADCNAAVSRVYDAINLGGCNHSGEILATLALLKNPVGFIPYGVQRKIAQTGSIVCHRLQDRMGSFKKFIAAALARLGEAA